MLFLLAGCLDRVLEGPLILGVVPGPLRSLSNSNRTLIVASEQGFFRVDGEGKVQLIDPEPPLAVTNDGTYDYRLYPDRLVRGERFLEVKGGKDMIAWYDNCLLLLGETQVFRVDFEGGRREVVATVPEESIGISFGVNRHFWVYSSKEVGEVDEQGHYQAVWSAQQSIRAVTVDHRDRMFVVDGENLLRVDGEETVLAARYLDFSTDAFSGPAICCPLKIYILPLKMGRFNM